MMSHSTRRINAYAAAAAQIFSAPLALRARPI
jgi:hypothetical protein